MPLRSEANWLILSNAESGDGFSDTLIEPEDPDAGIVIEVKYASDIAGLEKACGEALYSSSNTVIYSSSRSVMSFQEGCFLSSMKSYWQDRG